MALPWLIGAAAVATVGYLASSSSSSDDYDEKEERKERKRAKARKEELLRRELSNLKLSFQDKWGVEYQENSIAVQKIQKLINQEKDLKREIEKLEALNKEIKFL